MHHGPAGQPGSPHSQSLPVGDMRVESGGKEPLPFQWPVNGAGTGVRTTSRAPISVFTMILSVRDQQLLYSLSMYNQDGESES